MKMEELYHKCLCKTGIESSVKGINTKQTADGLAKLLVNTFCLYNGIVSERHLLTDSIELVFQEYGLAEFLYEPQTCVKNLTISESFVAKTESCTELSNKLSYLAISQDEIDCAKYFLQLYETTNLEEFKINCICIVWRNLLNLYHMKEHKFMALYSKF